MELAHNHSQWQAVVLVGHAVAQLIEALRYTPAGRGFDY
jgi:hypothetical protein